MVNYLESKIEPNFGNYNLAALNTRLLSNRISSEWIRYERSKRILKEWQ